MIQTKGQFSAINDIIEKSNYYLNSDKNKEKSIAYIYIILSFLALSLFGIFAIQPTLSTITELNKEYEENKIVLQKLQDKNRTLDTLNIQYQQLRGDLPFISKAIPDIPKASTLTRQIETLATGNNLSVDKIDIGQMEIFPVIDSETSIFEYTVSATVKGNDENINTFLKDVANLERMIEIKRLSSGNELDGFGAIISGKVFYFKQKTDI